MSDSMAVIPQRRFQVSGGEIRVKICDTNLVVYLPGSQVLSIDTHDYDPETDHRTVLRQLKKYLTGSTPDEIVDMIVKNHLFS